MARYLYIIHIPANKKAMIRFRLISHKLMIERGRWPGQIDYVYVVISSKMNPMSFVNILVIVGLESYILSHIM